MKKLFTVLLFVPFFSNAQTEKKGNAIGVVNTNNHPNKSMSIANHTAVFNQSTTATIFQREAGDCSTSSNTFVSVCASKLPYNWNGTDYTEEGNYAYHTLNANGCDSSANLILTVINTSATTITQTACNSYNWFEQTYTESGVYTHTLRNAEGCDSIISLVLTVNHFSADAVYGPSSTCAFTGVLGANAVYTVSNTGGTSFNWTVPPSATIISGQGTATIEVKYLSTFSQGIVKVSVSGLCGTTVEKSMNVSKAVPAIPAAIYGPSNACSYIGTGTPVTYSISPVANAITYRWTLPSTMTMLSATPDSTSITVLIQSGYAADHNKIVKVKSISGCGNSTDKSLTVSVASPQTPGLISGPVNACNYIGTLTTASYSIRKIPNTIFYVWTVPAGVTITSHPGGIGVNDTIINVLYDISFVNLSTIGVQALSECGVSAIRNLVITRKEPVFPGIISGPTDICGYISSATNPVTDLALYTIRKVNFATSYNWVVPVGATIESHPGGLGENDTCILVSYTSAFTGSGTVKVSGTNQCATSGQRALTVKTTLAAVPTIISGPTDVCTNIFEGTDATYVINKVPLATGYSWSLTDNVNAHIVSHLGSGENDTAILVHYDNAFFAGSVSVKSVRNCGSSVARSLAVAKRAPAVPTLSGPLTICTAKSEVYFASSPNTSSYTWSIPSGATSTGQGTASLNVTFPANFTSGSVSVKAVSVCGTSAFKTIVVSKCAPAGRLNISSGNSIVHQDKVSVYPNPSAGDFVIEINANEQTDKVQIEIINENGQVVFSKTQKNKNGRILLPVHSSFTAGIYMVACTIGGERITKRLVISR